jgi:hypothetical protein
VQNEQVDPLDIRNLISRLVPNYESTVEQTCSIIANIIKRSGAVVADYLATTFGWVRDNDVNQEEFCDRFEEEMSLNESEL